MDKDAEIAILKKALGRERAARKEAELIMEGKSLELYNSNQELLKLNESLEEEVQKRAAKIEAKEQQFTKLVESATDIIYKINPFGYFTYINPVTEKISGFSEEEMIGMNFVKLVRNDFRKELIQHYMNQLQKREETSYIQFPVVTKDGKELWIAQTATLVIEEGQPKEFIALARDITEVKLASEALRQSEEKYRGLIENLDLGLLEVGNDDKILKAYPQFCKLSGYSEKELLGKSPTQLLLNEEAKEIMAKQNEKRLKGEASVYELPIVKKNGKILWVMISGAPFYDTTGALKGTLGVHLDITKRRLMEEELRDAKLKAEHSSNAKEQFLANMSHEIRTPINGIDGMARLLENTQLNQEQLDYIAAIRTSADNLLVIINDILDFSKIEAGKMTIEKIGFDLKKSIDQTIKSIAYKAEEKGVLLEAVIDPEIPEILIGDPTRIGQVMINLINNAIKFTAKGSVQLYCKVLEKGKEKTTLKFEIIDTGVGIEKEKMTKIFDSFSQEDESTTRKYGGTGLGLSISKQLVNLFGSNLQVKSKKGEGTTFYFTINFNVGSKKDLVKESQHILSPESLEGKKVLLVEDNEINQFLAKTLLTKWKMIVDVVDNGKLAVERLQEEKYDVILMDMQMPVMGGIEATKILRKDLKLVTPIIALTASAIKGVDEECFAAGMDDYISKPFNHSELFNKILNTVNYGKVV